MMYTWTYIEQIVFSKPVHVDVSVRHDEVPDPTQNGYSRSIGDFHGQNADYEKTFTDGKRIHLRKFRNIYRAHWDFFSPILSPIQHLRYDAPEWYVLLSTLGFSTLGASCTEDEVSGAILGGGVGLILSLLTLPNIQDD